MLKNLNNLPLKYFGAGNFQVDHDWGEGGFDELAWVVDCVAIHDYELH